MLNIWRSFTREVSHPYLNIRENNNYTIRPSSSELCFCGDKRNDNALVMLLTLPVAGIGYGDHQADHALVQLFATFCLYVSNPNKINVQIKSANLILVKTMQVALRSISTKVKIELCIIIVFDVCFLFSLILFFTFEYIPNYTPRSY